MGVRQHGEECAARQARRPQAGRRLRRRSIPDSEERSRGDLEPHLFAKFNGGINFTVAVLLPAGIYLAKNKKYVLHKRVMMLAILLSSLFLISYVLHHLLTSSTAYPKDAGSIKYFYYFILITHIFLAGIILPFILITAYRALTAEFPVHKKIARITFPIWWYVSITGVLVYEMISPYY